MTVCAWTWGSLGRYTEAICSKVPRKRSYLTKFDRAPQSLLDPPGAQAYLRFNQPGTAFAAYENTSQCVKPNS